MRVDSQKLRRRLAKTTELTSPGVIGTLSSPTHTMRLHTRYQAAYGILLTLAIIANSILRAFDPYDISLVEESATFFNEIMALAEHASQYRPLGASYIPMCLIAAWAATNDTSRRAEVEKMLAEYQTDMAGARWMDGAIWLENRFEGLRLKLSSHLEQPHDNCCKADYATSVDPEEAMGTRGSCCVQ